MANWSVTLRGVTIQTTTAYEFEAGGITGLGNPSVRTADQERGQLHGDVGGDDVFEKRVITIPALVLGDTPEDCMTKLTALKVAWAPSYTDIPLTVSVAGASLTFNGRPRGCDADLSFLGTGSVARVFLTFEALVPYAVGSSESVPIP